ncbi:2og-fe oxygenase superfamily protein, partial [Colletotrichum kahawae]
GSAVVATVAVGAAKGFGLSNIKLNPHKLLLYETGSFFKKHKDSEKEPGMIGTLVVVLPSEHQGGDVHVSFGSDVRSFSTAPFSTFDITALAWFSDVSHEVKELVSGYRLALTYNIIQQTGEPQSAAFWGQQAQEVKKLLRQWENNFPEEDFLVYPLDHKYSQSTVSVQNMKGRDKAVCKILQNVGSESGVYLLFGHMTRSEQGAMPHWYGYGAEDDDDDEEDTYTTMNKIYSAEGDEIDASIDPEKEQILDMDKFTSGNADSEDEGEFTGNEAAENTLRYHNYVVVLLKKKSLRFHHIGSTASLLQFENSISMVASDLEKHIDDRATRSAAQTFLRDCIERHGISANGVYMLTRCAMQLDDSDLFRKVMSSAAEQSKKIHSKALGMTRDYLEEKFTSNPDAVEWEKWIGTSAQSSLGALQTTVSKLCYQFKSEALRKSFAQWGLKKLNEKLESQEVMTTEELVFFTHGLKVHNENQDWIKSTLLQTLVVRGTRDLLYQVLSSVFENREKPEYLDAMEVYGYVLDQGPGPLLLQGSDIIPRPIRAGGACSGPLREFTAIFNNVLDLGLKAHGLKLLNALCDNLVRLKKEWEPKNVGGDVMAKLIGPLITALETHGIPGPSALKDFLQLVLGEGLHKQIPPRPPKPLGWNHKPKNKCNRFTGAFCRACDELHVFLANKKDKVWRYQTGDSLRNHVEAMLRTSTMMGHFKLTTERVGSPYTLVVEKTGREYADELDYWKESLITLEH